MSPTLTRFFADYTSYVVVVTSLLTCYEFFKSRSWILVLTTVAAVLFLAVVFHNPILNCLSGITELIGIYTHSINQGTKGINWKKLSAILGIPLAILLISRFFSLPWEIILTVNPTQNTNILWQVTFVSTISLVKLSLVVELVLGVIGGFVSAYMTLSENNYSTRYNDFENAAGCGGCLASLLSVANAFIFTTFLKGNIDIYYDSGGARGGFVEAIVNGISAMLAVLIVPLTVALIATCMVFLVHWITLALAKMINH